MTEMRKNLKYLEDTKWMYENNNGLDPLENISNTI